MLGKDNINPNGWKSIFSFNDPNNVQEELEESSLVTSDEEDSSFSEDFGTPEP